ncbi:putative nucleotidyltransferase [Desulfoscipio gibsoniae DSM 7213]|uniref:Putative nucleotidyltransferase n=2 Tax=Desulfoscipio gibsoniae TaxID=102134 RepID=R4KGF9_9FIRM|nr:putative nucleotidyltransferase [Desulfoscipio gibsoniae DSM 7213]
MNPADCIREHMSELRDTYRVSKLGIFGSYARGEAKESSDVDILVEFSDYVDLFHFIRLQSHLTEILGRKVDLVTPDALKPIIKDIVLQEVLYI